MNILKALKDYIEGWGDLSNFGLSEIQYEEISGAAMPRCGIYGTGSYERDIYIGGEKEVDFGFRIVYHCISEDTNGRITANEFFAELLSWFRGQTKSGLEGLDIGEGKKPLKIDGAAATKMDTKTDNSQEWSANFTLTYQQGS